MKITLYWRPRISQRKKKSALAWIKKYYQWVKWNNDFITFNTVRADTKYIWIFMFSKAFDRIE
jgi:hypothetical protein